MTIENVLCKILKQTTPKKYSKRVTETVLLLAAGTPTLSECEKFLASQQN